MIKIRSAVVAVAAFVSLVASLVLMALIPTHGAIAKQDVRVVNTIAEAVPTTAQGTTSVRDVDEPARQPFQTNVAITIPHAESAALATLAVPIGKRLVVEFVSVQGNVLHGRTLVVAVTVAGSVGDVSHVIALNDPRPLGNDFYTASQPVRIYAAADALLLFTAQHSVDPSEPGLDSQVSIGISGYLVDVP